MIGGHLLGILHGQAQVGQPNADFAPVPVLSERVGAIAVQADQKIIVAGGTSASPGVRVARLHADGTVDSGFNVGPDSDLGIWTIAMQGDGKILVGGWFNRLGGEARQQLARLNVDGTLDADFIVGEGPEAPREVIDIEMVAGSQVIVAGNFSSFNAQPRPYLTRLRANGSVDLSFDPKPNSTVRRVAVRPDGRLVIAGEFTRIGNRLRSRVAQLLPDGSLDESFDPGEGPNAFVSALALDPEGRVLIGGGFTAVSGVSRTYLGRLTERGLVDLGFDASANNYVWVFGVQSDGRILAGGDFTQINGETANRLVRLRPNGTVDRSFDSGTGPNASVSSIAVQADGNVLVGGDFTEFNGLSRKWLVQVQGVSAAPGGELSFSAPMYRVAEGQSSAVIEVTRVGTTSQPVSVSYLTSNGTARGGDYTAQSGRLTFEAGVRSATFSVPIRSDTSVENEETVILTLSNPSGGAVLGGQQTATLMIEDDDLDAGVGKVDGGFDSAASGAVQVAALQPDGKIVVAGFFAGIGGESRLRIARLNRDGTLDSAFLPSAWLDGPAYALAVQGDGRILVGGAFTMVNGEPRTRMARFLSDGTLDPTFDPGPGPNGVVYAIKIQPNGDLIVGGDFTHYAGEPRAYLMRLFSDGSLDTDYSVSLNGGVRALAASGDGRLWVGGGFTVVANRQRNRVARLFENGALDESFNPGAGPNSTVYAMGLQSDDRILLGGAFNEVNGSPRGYVCRLEANGLVDVGFKPMANNVVYTLVNQSDGKVVIGGEFTQVDGTNLNRLARLRSDGTIDAGFNTGEGANGAVSTVAVQLDGQVVVGGTFTEFDGLERPRLVRLNGASAAGGGDLEFASAIFQVSEAQTSAVIEVRRFGATNNLATVTFATSNGTANARDYTAQSGRLTFAAGETSRTFAVPIRADTQVEDDETVTVTLSSPGGGADLGTLREATLVIRNDDGSMVVGDVDVGLDTGANGTVHATAIQPDGKIVVVGGFSELKGGSRLRIGRLNSDGTLDNSFLPSAWLDGIAYAVAVQTDGRVLVGGAFTIANGVTRNRLARFLDDGTLDPTFEPGAGPNGPVFAIKPQADGDILVGGAFTHYGTDPRSYLMRVYSDGSLDPSFSPVLNNVVRCLAPVGTGGWVVGGDFSQIGNRVRNRVARILPNGTIDESFDPGVGPNSSVYTLATSREGGVLIGGAFSDVSGTGRPYLCQLDGRGLPDLRFRADLDNVVYSLAQQADGRSVVGGEFTRAGGTNRFRVARLLPDGSADLSFSLGAGANAAVRSVEVQLDGNIVLAGDFTQFNSLNRSRLVRLQGVSAAGGGEIEFGAARYQVVENQPTVAIEVRRIGTTTEAVTVDCATINGTATAGDYVGSTRTLVFGPNEITQTFRITIRDDTTVEDPKTVVLTLGNPGGGADLGAQRTAILTIVDDDRATALGAVETTFAGRASGPVHSLAAQADGKVVVVGDFSELSGQARLRIGRVNPDGALDPTFRPGAWLDAAAQVVLVQADGRIVVGGQFTVANGVPRTRLARFLPDGSLDMGFDPGIGPNSTVYTIALQSEGDMLVGGAFSAFNNVARPYLARVFPDGNLDATFQPQLNGPVWTLGMMADGAIVAGGDFTSAAATIRNRVARFRSNGVLDEAFDPVAGPNSTVRALAIEPDGRVLIGGGFSDVNGSGQRFISRLETNGLPDVSYVTSLNSWVYAMARRGDGKVVLGGEFTQVSGKELNRVVRLSADGSVDPTFHPGAGANGSVWSLLLQSDGSLVVGGQFTQFGDLDRPRLVRLLAADDVPPVPFQFTGITLDSRGIVLAGSGEAGRRYVLQYSRDLVSWFSLVTNSAASSTVEWIDPKPSDGNRLYRTLVLP